MELSSNLNKRTKITQDIIYYCITNGLSVSGFESGDNPKVKDLLIDTSKVYKKLKK